MAPESSFETLVPYTNLQNIMKPDDWDLCLYRCENLACRTLQSSLPLHTQIIFPFTYMFPSSKYFVMYVFRDLTGAWNGIIKWRLKELLTPLRPNLARTTVVWSFQTNILYVHAPSDGKVSFIPLTSFFISEEYKWLLSILKTEKKEKLPFYLMPPDFRKSAAFWKVPMLRPFVSLVRTARRWTRIWSVGGKPKYWEKNLSQCYFKR